MRAELDIAEAALSAALKAGADEADAIFVNSESTSVALLNGAPENIERSENRDLGLRVLVGRRQAIVSSSRFLPGDIATLAERAVAMAKAAPPDPYAGLAASDQLARNGSADAAALDLADDADPDVATLMLLAKEAEDAGLEVKGVARSSGASARAGRRSIALAASNGFRGGYSRSGYGISATMVAGEGTAMERDGDYTAAVHWSDLETAESIGRSAGERVVRRLNPQKLPSGRLPVVFDERVARGLVGDLSAAANGSSVARGTSFLKEKLGERVFREGILIVDDPRRRRGQASRPFDAEGVGTRAMPLVEDGILKTWVLDCRSARQLSLATTGSASRGTGSPPSPSVTNLHLAPGARTREALIGDIRDGLLVTELIGHGVNIVTGDYSRGAAGFRIENGLVTTPVSEITIAGNLADMFLALEPADDLVFRGSVNAPTCLVGEMTIAGR